GFVRISMYVSIFCLLSSMAIFFFFFEVPPTTVIYTLSLHDALPICSMLAKAIDTIDLDIALSVWLRSASFSEHRCEHEQELKMRSEEHTSELQSLRHLVCRLLLEKKKYKL